MSALHGRDSAAHAVQDSRNLPGKAVRHALAPYLGRLWEDEQELANAFRLMAFRHDRDPEMRAGCELMAEWTNELVFALSPFVERYGKRRSLDAEHVRGALFNGARWGVAGLLRDAQDLALLTDDIRLGWTALQEAAPELHDRELEETAKSAKLTTQRQIAWLESRIRQTAPEALTIPPDRIATRLASIPKSLSPATLPPVAWAPISSGAVILVLGLAGAAVGMPLLVSSFGASIYRQALEPAHPTTKPRNILLGHAIGFACGAAATLAFGLWDTHPVFAGGAVTLKHVLAASMALALTLALTFIAKVNHPPAGATTLLAVLGILHRPMQIVTLLVGFVLVTAPGKIMRQLRTRPVTASSLRDLIASSP